MAWLPDSPLARIAIIVAIAATAHLVVRAVEGRVLAARPHPKVTTVLGLLHSAATFLIWFVAVGVVLRVLEIDLTAYFATATVIGLAVAFGAQGLVQDVVIGLTLIFSDALDVGDVVEVSGQVGRVQRVGLRFTTLTNFLGQTVVIPNRNISVVGRFRSDVIRAFVDVQLPAGAPDDVATHLHGLARGLRSQHPTAIISEPELVGVQEAEEGGWRFVRLRFHLWPGQQALLDAGFRQRVVAFMKTVDPAYADWMVTVTLRG